MGENPTSQEPTKINMDTLYNNLEKLGKKYGSPVHIIIQNQERTLHYDSSSIKTFPYFNVNDLVLSLNSGNIKFPLNQNTEFTDSGEAKIALNQFVNGIIQAVTIVTSDNNAITVVYMKIE